MKLKHTDPKVFAVEGVIEREGLDAREILRSGHYEQVFDEDADKDAEKAAAKAAKEAKAAEAKAAKDAEKAAKDAANKGK